jgi:hypothetical protein
MARMKANDTNKEINREGAKNAKKKRKENKEREKF